jgi:hypothetical protein
MEVTTTRWPLASPGPFYAAPVWLNRGWGLTGLPARRPAESSNTSSLTAANGSRWRLPRLRPPISPDRTSEGGDPRRETPAGDRHQRDLADDFRVGNEPSEDAGDGRRKLRDKAASGMVAGGREGAKKALAEFWHRISHAAMKSPLQPTLLDRLLGDHSKAQSRGFVFSELLTRLFLPYEFNPLNQNPLRQVLLDSVDFDALSPTTCPIKLYLAATNVRTGKIKVFGNAEIWSVLAKSPRTDSRRVG